jgi:hypothetical protein
MEFLLIIPLFLFTIFSFVVTNKGVGKLVSNKGNREYPLGDYMYWLQKQVKNGLKGIDTFFKVIGICCFGKSFEIDQNLLPKQIDLLCITNVHNYVFYSSASHIFIPRVLWKSRGEKGIKRKIDLGFDIMINLYVNFPSRACSFHSSSGTTEKLFSRTVGLKKFFDLECFYRVSNREDRKTSLLEWVVDDLHPIIDDTQIWTSTHRSSVHCRERTTRSMRGLRHSLIQVQ